MSDQQMRPASPEQAPDPSFNYERSRPEREAGAGRMDNNSKATPAATPDKIAGPVANAQDPGRSLTAQDVASPQPTDGRRAAGQTSMPQQPDHSMKDEEPLGWDQTPTGGGVPGQQRHPRTGGQGGTPNVGIDPRKS
jgi:hypothetical protein